MEGFAFVHREQVRFADLDGMGHVNNAVFSTYLEQARLAWAGAGAQAHFILARTEIDFRAQAGMGEIEIGVRTSRIGTKSFELEYELRQGGTVVAEAKSVLVGYDYARNESAEIPGEWRRRLTA